MYAIKSIDDLNRCIDLEKGVALECYLGTADNIVEIHCDNEGKYLVHYRMTDKFITYNRAELAESIIGKAIAKQRLHTYSFSLNGVAFQNID